MYDASLYDEDFTKSEIDTDPIGKFIAICEDITMAMNERFGNIVSIKFKIFAQDYVGKIVTKDYFLDGEWGSLSLTKLKNDLFKMGLKEGTLTQCLNEKQSVVGKFFNISITYNKDKDRYNKYINSTVSKDNIDYYISHGYSIDCTKKELSSRKDMSDIPF